MATSIPINLFVTIGLPFYGGGIPPQPPRKLISHQPNGRQLGDSQGGGLLGGGSPNRNPFEGPPPNPFDGAYGWPSLDPKL
jgi:hypothetical protein